MYTVTIRDNNNQFSLSIFLSFFFRSLTCLAAMSKNVSYWVIKQIRGKLTIGTLDKLFFKNIHSAARSEFSFSVRKRKKRKDEKNVENILLRFALLAPYGEAGTTAGSSTLVRLTF